MSKEKKNGFIKDFKAFITKGNVVDMAVGVVIGASFGKIITGLVNYIINPFVGIFVKSGNLDSLKTVITPAVVDETGAVTAAEVALLWGTWLQTIIDFLITALCIFVVLRIIMRVKNRVDAEKIAEQKAKDDEAKAKAEADAKAAEAARAAEAAKLEEFRLAVIEQKKIVSEIGEILKKKQ